MSTWEDRMAERSAMRRVAAEAAEGVRQAEDYARLAAAAGPPVPGEHEYIAEEGEHRGHRTHMHPSHGGGVICQCGAFLGLTSFIPDWDAPPPEPCPVCIARGIPLGGR